MPPLELDFPFVSASMDLLHSARSRITRLSPLQAYERIHAGARLIDLRTTAHRFAPEEGGDIPGAIIIDLTVLPWRVDPEFDYRIPEATPGAEWILICRHGYSSSLAAATLQDMGINACDVDGGFAAWRRAGLPVADASTAADVRL